VAGVRVRCTSGFMDKPCDHKSHARKLNEFGRPKHYACAICRAKWKGDWLWVLRENLSLVRGPVRMVTLTLPGAAVLPWDEDVCAWTGEHCHDGRLGCRVQHESLVAFCEDLQTRFHRLMSAARYAAKVRGPMVLALKWESQARGAPHVHLCIPATPMGERFVGELVSRREAYGFGEVVDRGFVSAGHLPAFYFAKYAAKPALGDELARREYIDYEQFLPRRVHYVSRVLTMRSGATVRNARLIRALWAFAEGYREQLPKFRDDFEEAHVRWHYRARRRGRDNLPARSVVLPDHGWDARFGVAPWCGEPVAEFAIAA